MFVIGLTGGIASGKTLASQTLESLGAVIINADLVGHEAYLPHTETWRAVVDAFGEDIIDSDGRIVRPKLGAIVFGDPSKLKLLNSIVHPRIYAMIGDRIDELAREGVEVVVVEAALLIEAGWTPIADEIWVLTTPTHLAIERLADRGMSEEQARARIASQMPQETRVSHADIVIPNYQTPDALRGALETQWKSRVAARIQGDQEST